VAGSHEGIGARTIFRLGEQKLNDFSVGEAKFGEKQSRQSNSKYNFMQYVFIEKCIGPTPCTVGSGEFLRIFVLKVTLQPVRLLLTVSYRKKLGEQNVLVAPQ